MPSVELINKSSETASKATAESKQAGGSQVDKGDLFSYVFFLLIVCMNTRQAGVLTQSKELTNNAADQEKDNNWEKELHFRTIPQGAKTATIDQIQNYNKEVSDQRANVQNQLITLRQQSQILMTQANTGVNSLEQDASMDSGWLKTLQQIFQVILQMAQRSY